MMQPLLYAIIVEQGGGLMQLWAWFFLWALAGAMVSPLIGAFIRRGMGNADEG